MEEQTSLASDSTSRRAQRAKSASHAEENTVNRRAEAGWPVLRSDEQGRLASLSSLGRHLGQAHQLGKRQNVAAAQRASFKPNTTNDGRQSAFGQPHNDASNGTIGPQGIGLG